MDPLLKAIATPEFVDIIADRVIEKLIIDSMLPVTEEKGEVNFTVPQVAKLMNKSVATITRHIRQKHLCASKVGKCWTITEEDYNNYKFNRRK